MKSGKPSTCYSDNPKMGQPYAMAPQPKGYQDGGLVLEEDDKPEVAIGLPIRKKRRDMEDTKTMFTYRKDI